MGGKAIGASIGERPRAGSVSAGEEERAVRRSYLSLRSSRDDDSRNDPFRRAGRYLSPLLQRLNLGRIKRDSNVWWNSAPHDASIILHLLSSRPVSVNLHGYRYLQPTLEDLNMAVIEMEGGTSAFVYHNWLYPENTAKLTVVGSKRLLVYDGKFDKRSITVYEYEVENAPMNKSLANELPTTMPSKMLASREIAGFKDQEPLAGAVKDFLESILDDRVPLSSGNFALQVLAVLEAGERSVRANGARATVET